MAIFKCPDTNAISLFTQCDRAGWYSVLVKPATGNPRNPTDGRIPHIRYTIGQGKWLDYEENGRENQGTFRQGLDQQIRVEFDAGTFCCLSPGSIELVGGNPDATVEVTITHLKGVLAVPHWHLLTTRLDVAGMTTIPDYHNEVSSWTAGAGATLEGDAIDLPPGRWNPCISGTSLANGRMSSLMVCTRWWG